MSDTIKYWLCVIAIAAGTAWYSDRISAGVIFLIAGGAIFIYWQKTARQKQRNVHD